jgi:hypothetical protein
MADSIMLAIAQANHAVLWTQGGHLENIEGVKFVAKQTESD